MLMDVGLFYGVYYNYVNPSYIPVFGLHRTTIPWSPAHSLVTLLTALLYSII